jgi:outer membrane lipoprotein carrier protein
MKKLLFTLVFAASSVFANPQLELIERLSKLSGFSAHFTQKVTSPEGKLINEGKGELAIRRPNLFKWETQTPEETYLISDGITFWYFNPFIEQVTALWLEDATEQTPFVLLTRNNANDWKKYKVEQKKDLFILSPKKVTNMSEFEVNVSKDGKIKYFSVVEQDGQKSHFELSDLSAKLPPLSLFKFTPPKGAEMDDQRQK